MDMAIWMIYTALEVRKMAYGSVTQRGDTYRVCFDYGKDGAGKRIRKYQTFATKKEATRALHAHKVKKVWNCILVGFGNHNPGKMSLCAYCGEIGSVCA